MKTAGSNSTGASLPIWLKLERNGSTVTTFRLADGVNWLLQLPQPTN